MRKGQEQSGGDGAINIQSGATTNLTIGLSATEARQIAIDVSRAQLFEMRDIAQSIVDARLEKFTDAIIHQAKRRDSRALGALVDPDVQYAVSVAGRDFARSGESWLMDELARLLVERFMADGSTLRALALNEAISVVGRLTRKQVSTLTSIWMLHHVEEIVDVWTLEDLAVWITNELAPIISDACVHNADYEYLLYIGCISKGMMPCPVADILSSRFPGIFSNGIEVAKMESTLEEYHSAILEHCDQIFYTIEEKPGLIFPRHASRAQVYSWAENVYSLEAGDKLAALIEEAMMDTSDAIDLLMDVDDNSYQLYEDTAMGEMSLTTIGKTIAHTHWASRSRQSKPLDFWIPNDHE